MTSSELQTIPETGNGSRARTAIWLVVASILGLYLVLRFGVSSDPWPTPQDLRLNVTKAAVSACFLVISSLTLAFARSALRREQARMAQVGLVVTLFLSMGFLFFQISEYRQRWKDNLIPNLFGNGLYDRPDLYYLSAGHQRLNQLAMEVNADRIRQNQLSERLRKLTDSAQEERDPLDDELRRLQAEESQRSKRLVTINRLIGSEVRWTELIVASVDDVVVQRTAIAALAYDVFPLPTFAGAHRQFREYDSQQLDDSLAAAQRGLNEAEKSAKENSEPIKQLLNAVAESKAELEVVESKLKTHLRQRTLEEEEGDAPDQTEDLTRNELEKQLSQLRRVFDERTAKLTVAAQTVTASEDRAAQFLLEISNLNARKEIIAEIDHYGVGLNAQFEWLRLPVCIPRGHAWAYSYYLLTSLHSALLVYLSAMVTLGVIGPRRWENDRHSTLSETVRDWHGMVALGVILLLLVYLI